MGISSERVAWKHLQFYVAVVRISLPRLSKIAKRLIKNLLYKICMYKRTFADCITKEKLAYLNRACEKVRQCDPHSLFRYHNFIIQHRLLLFRQQWQSIRAMTDIYRDIHPRWNYAEIFQQHEIPDIDTCAKFTRWRYPENSDLREKFMCTT